RLVAAGVARKGHRRFGEAVTLQIGKPYTGHWGCLLSEEAQETIIGINSSITAVFCPYATGPPASTSDNSLYVTHGVNTWAQGARSARMPREAAPSVCCARFGGGARGL